MSEAAPVDPNTITLGEALAAKCKEAFGKVDTDNSDEIDLEEAKKMFKSFGKVAAGKLLSDMDENSDGKICYKEWEFYFKRVMASGQYGEDESSPAPRKMSRVGSGKP